MAETPSPIRRANLTDLDALERLEELSFVEADRSSRKHLRFLLREANATNLVVEHAGVVAGAATVLWRRNAYTGRLYSIATDPALRGRGLGERLLEAVEEDARKHGCTRMRLEVRPENATARGFYTRRGYKESGTIPGFYGDGMDAVRMVKRLRARKNPLRLTMPFYTQTMDFTCGPASLMMAMKYHTPRLVIDKALELMLWKEATLIFMTEGLGGCGPFGLALAAQRRGYASRVIISDTRTPFLTSVRTDEKREVVVIVHEAMKKEARRLGVGEQYFNFGIADIADAIRSGEVPIVLISTYRLHGEKSPHWVVVTGFDERYVYFHDPDREHYVDDQRAAQHLRIPVGEFQHMHRYGKMLQKSMVIIGRRTRPPVSAYTAETAGA